MDISDYQAGELPPRGQEQHRMNKIHQATDTIELWKSSFGDDYTQRNGSIIENLLGRLRIWQELLPRHCESVLEVGANIGLNLEAIAQRKQCEMYACEPNYQARLELLKIAGIEPDHITADTADALSFPDGVADLVFTSGVLIHIPPDKLLKSMQEIYRCAKRWIICGEYFAPQEEMIPYRGQDNAMWRRDYGSLFLDNFPDLRCINTRFAWKRATGLDNLTFWVFEKQ